MSTTTENYNFIKPGYSDSANISVISEDLDMIDTVLAQKANDTDNIRTTANKTVTGAINELNSEKSPLTSPAFTGAPTANGHNILTSLSGGYKIQSGITSITVSTAGTPVIALVNFPTSFSSNPLVFLTPTSGSGGSNGYLILQAQNAGINGFNLYINSFTAETEYVNWIAIGI
jgi:hypothetical protein